ncbi:MAG: hypothetical protein IT200_14075 [Thermoleophilia bacterium]|nr:hypothetical protein [Thermoleophilia bacterium]
MNGGAHESPLPEPPVTRLSLPLVQVVASGALRLGADPAVTAAEPPEGRAAA